MGAALLLWLAQKASTSATTPPMVSTLLCNDSVVASDVMPCATRRGEMTLTMPRMRESI